jgi:hypothetical protein
MDLGEPVEGLDDPAAVDSDVRDLQHERVGLRRTQQDPAHLRTGARVVGRSDEGDRVGVRVGRVVDTRPKAFRARYCP